MNLPVEPYINELQDTLHDATNRIQDAIRILAVATKPECGTFETRYYYDEMRVALKVLEGK